ncbi:MAG TPA: ThuA domain-containing protein [Candidatus Saccharimonadales bacterium]|nr:ThuA domain-containing protein [Candidatus Saccharimonadales bacterium]
MMTKPILLFLLAGTLSLSAAEPKKVLLVTVTTEFRHSSIGTAEKVLQRLGEESKAFTIVDIAQQPNVKIAQKPNKPQKPASPKADADEKAVNRYNADLKRYEADLAKYEQAMAKWTSADEDKVKSAQSDYNAALKASLAKLSPENLQKYDAVIFANTTGDLPLPDKNAFIDWVKQGHGFIAMHSGSDTFHPFKPYISMLGGEFQTHGAQVSVDAINKDKQHPATKHLGDTFTIFDEIYIIKTYNPADVHELLVLDKHPNTKEPGHYAVSWCKNFGQGKVFYTSLGHREDVWNPEEKNRKNSREVSEAYDQHILGGIKWALGLEPGDATPQAK